MVGQGRKRRENAKDSSLTCRASSETIPVDTSELRVAAVRLGLKTFRGARQQHA